MMEMSKKKVHQHCSLQMSYKRIGLYDACMILYQRKWHALYSASAFRPFPLLRNLCQFYLHIYQMYLFRRCHCIHIIASILSSSQPLSSQMMRYIAHRFFIIHSSLRPLFCFCVSERFLYQRKLMRGCWIFKDLIKNGFCQLYPLYLESMLYLIWI